MFNIVVYRIIAVVWAIMGIIAYLPIIMAPEAAEILTVDRVQAFLYVFAGMTMGGIAEILERIKDK